MMCMLISNADKHARHMVKLSKSNGMYMLIQHVHAIAFGIHYVLFFELSFLLLQPIHREAWKFIQQDMI